MKHNKEKNNLSFKRTISNNIYIVKLCWSASSGNVLYAIITSILGGFVSFVDFYFTRYALNDVQIGLNFRAISMVLLILATISFGYYGLCRILGLWLEPYSEYKLKYFFKSIVSRRVKSVNFPAMKILSFMISTLELWKSVKKKLLRFLIMLLA